MNDCLCLRYLTDDGSAADAVALLYNHVGVPELLLIQRIYNGTAADISAADFRDLT